MIQATSRNVPGNAAHSGPQTNPKRLATKLKTLLNPRSLRSLITNVHADHGRERYRRITASTSFLSKALTIVSVSHPFRSRFGARTIRRLARDQ